ncbi:MAG: hypothetical protein O2807_09550 [bacterium]|nr:hypothetical protein [bacterium]
MLPISELQVIQKDPRTIQRWGWRRTGETIELAGMILFVSTPPVEDLWMRVELADEEWNPVGAAVSRLQTKIFNDWAASSFCGGVTTEVGPPYRLRVLFMGNGALASQSLQRTPEIRPWNRKELPSSS